MPKKHRVPAGEALAVDREPFAEEVTRTLVAHPNITVVREEVTRLPESRPLILATGPLTSDALAGEIARLTGNDSLSFFDAVAPTVTLDSLDMTKVFRASRRGKGSGIRDQGSETPTAENDLRAKNERFRCGPGTLRKHRLRRRASGERRLPELPVYQRRIPGLLGCS